MKRNYSLVQNEKLLFWACREMPDRGTRLCSKLTIKDFLDGIVSEAKIMMAVPMRVLLTHRAVEGLHPHMSRKHSSGKAGQSSALVPWVVSFPRFIRLYHALLSGLLNLFKIASLKGRGCSELSAAVNGCGYQYLTSY